MNEDTIISWDESLKSTAGKYLKWADFPEDENVIIEVANWRNVERELDKYENGKKVEGQKEMKKMLVMDVVEFDGKECEKELSSPVYNWKKKVRPHLETATTATVRLNVIRTGEKTSINFIIQKVE